MIWADRVGVAVALILAAVFIFAGIDDLRRAAREREAPKSESARINCEAPQDAFERLMCADPNETDAPHDSRPMSFPLRVLAGTLLFAAPLWLVLRLADWVFCGRVRINRGAN